MTIRLVDDCFRPTEQRLRHADALALLAKRAEPVTGTEAVPLWQANGRVCSEDVVAPYPVPLHTNSAVDGYAFANRTSADAPDGSRSTTELRLDCQVVGRAAAGHPFIGTIAAGQACRILTGAVLPAGTDTVAMQEDVEVGEGDRVRLPLGLKTGANVRRAGEDLAAGTVVVEAGRVLRPQDLAALASVGQGEVRCRERLKVAVVSTGDEVRRAGASSAPLNPGQVFDANSAMLAALVALTGAEAVDLGVWPDHAGEVLSRLTKAAAEYHVILTTGGASLGDEDHMASALAALGSRHFWQIAVKPGRPLMFGQIGASVVVGLPGNPVAVFVCYLMYVRPLIARLGGAGWPEPRRYLLPAAFEFTGRKQGRREYWRGSVVATADGPAVEKFARDGSGLISGLRAADGLIEIPEDAGDVRPGDRVAFIPFAEFAIAPR